MSLLLDARQRAMLQEMGVTLWAPPAPSMARPRSLAEDDTGAAAQARPPVAAPLSAAPSTTTTPARPTAAPSVRPPPTASDGRPTSPASPPGVAALTPAGVASGLPALQLLAPHALYPHADAAQTPPGLGSAWLIVVESAQPHAPLEGDAGLLLDNMLRAMQLHRHPQVYLCALQRSAPSAEPAHPAGSGLPVDEQLAQVVQTLEPAMVLLLGHVAARCALGRSEPLGRLRAGPHHVAGRPAIVTYDPAFLLRSQSHKASAWADLCTALAMVRRAEPGQGTAGPP